MRTCSALPHQSLQRIQIHPVVVWFVYRRFGDEGGVSESLVVEQAAEGLETHRPLAYVLVAIQLRAARRLASFMCQTRTSLKLMVFAIKASVSS
jgi:hypothetical protein